LDQTGREGRWAYLLGSDTSVVYSAVASGAAPANCRRAMFFNSWADLGRTLIVGVLAYAALVVMLRVSGKRTLSKMNAFDLIVTVALGSTLATILLSKDVALAEGLLAFATLIGLQFVVAATSVRWQPFRKIVKAQPTLLYHEGRFLDEALWEERVVRDEVIAAIRAQGVVSMSEVAAVVLETDGSFTTLKKSSGEDPSALQNVRRAPGANGSHRDDP
jgi:uncharacterized membrane protein YcaP (DUF421 family)